MPDASSRYEVVIGLEVHAQLRTASKAFCGCRTTYGAPPNTQICPVCLALPGALPVYNENAARLAVTAALALSGDVHRVSVFSRKNYFYPDLPKGYQISQYDRPLSTGGHLDIDVDGVRKRVGLTRIHVEEDAGKNLHDEDGPSRIDLNRAGLPLIEIVSEPDMRSPEEAMAYVRALRGLLRWLGVCDGNMEEGSLRCDGNVSVRPVGRERFGTKVEIKNMNSVRFLGRALAWEVTRQVDLLEAGGQVAQETRTFDPARGETVFMRSKEQAHDYRYFPEPDLPPLVLDEGFVAAAARAMPELPVARAERWQREWQLSPYDAGVLTAERDISDWFQSAAGADGTPARAKKVANWMMGEILRRLNDEGGRIGDRPMHPAQLAELVALVDDGRLTGPAARQTLDEVWRTGEGPTAVVERLGLQTVSDEGALDGAIRAAFLKNPKEYDRLRGGETKLVAFFMGQVMRETGGKGDPPKVQARIRALLELG